MSFKVVLICYFEGVIISFRNAWEILDRAPYPNAELYLHLKTKCGLRCKGLLELMLASSTFGKGECSWINKWAWKLWSHLPWWRMMGFTLPSGSLDLGTGGSFSVVVSLLKTNHRKGCISYFTWCMDFTPAQIREGTCSQIHRSWNAVPRWCTRPSPICKYVGF